MLSDHLSEFQPRHARHHEVGDDEAWSLAVKDIQRLLGAGGGYGQKALIFECKAQYVCDQVLVVNDQNAFHALHALIQDAENAWQKPRPGRHPDANPMFRPFSH